MKKNEKKALKGKLLTAIRNVIKTDNGSLKPNSEKAIEKSIKKIVRHTVKRKGPLQAK
ncbi:MAG TPA: hypothetical protein VNZ45_13410 [Bacteroidia bacterium]|nr:hypothetical protein [Bacteroidia bacterium]